MNIPESVQTKTYTRWMIKRDLTEVIQIENDNFPSNPWSKEEFLHKMRNTCYIGMIVEIGEKIVGYMVYKLHTKRMQVVRFAVHKDHRRQGIGKLMVANLISKLQSHKRTKITLFVRESNLAAQLFYRSQGFLAIVTLRNHYRDNREDAYLMEYQLVAEESESHEEVSDGATLV